MHWQISSVVLLFALIAFVIGIVLALSVISRPSEQVEADRANTTRSYLLLLASVALVLFVLAVQRLELAEAVSHLLH